MSKKKTTATENTVTEEVLDTPETTQESTTDTPEKEEETAEDETAVLEEALQKEKDKFLRLFAEFENYKKRTTKERIELFKTANQEVIQAILPVLDDFDRARSAIEESKDSDLAKGVTLIHNKLKETLKNKGLEEVTVAQGDAFNADNHEAITQIPAPSDELKGKIVDVVEKGYKLGEKIIRFPKVVTGQ